MTHMHSTQNSNIALRDTAKEKQKLKCEKKGGV